MVPFETIFALSMVRASCTMPRYFSWTLRGNAVVVVEFIQFCAFLIGGSHEPVAVSRVSVSAGFWGKECCGRPVELRFGWSDEASLARTITAKTAMAVGGTLSSNG